MFPFYKQQDSMDCGPTCLRIVAKHYKKSISAQTLREKSQIGKDGVNLLGISEAAEAIGFRTHSVKITYGVLIRDAKLPAILHWRQSHFVVLYKVKRNKLFISDPASGLRNLNEQEFQSAWVSDKTNGENEGIALLLESSPLFYVST